MEDTQSVDSLVQTAVLDALACEEDSDTATLRPACLWHDTRGNVLIPPSRPNTHVGVVCEGGSTWLVVRLFDTDIMHLGLAGPEEGHLILTPFTAGTTEITSLTIRRLNEVIQGMGYPLKLKLKRRRTIGGDIKYHFSVHVMDKAEAIRTKRLNHSLGLGDGQRIQTKLLYRGARPQVRLTGVNPAYPVRDVGLTAGGFRRLDLCTCKPYTLTTLEGPNYYRFMRK